MAKRFRFRLETVLKIRKQREDEAKRVVAERLRRIADVGNDIDSMRSQISSEIKSFRQSHASGRIDTARISNHRHWLIHLDQNVLASKSHLGELEAELAQERVALGEARKQVRVLEKLEERQRARHAKELNRAEALESDEIGNNLYLRQRRAVSG